MHEAAITQALHEQVVPLVPAGRRLLEVHVKIGELEHLDPSVMAAMWEALIEGTDLRGAALRLSRVPLRVRCRDCRAEYAPPDPFLLVCPACETAHPEVLEGSGIILESLEVSE